MLKKYVVCIRQENVRDAQIYGEPTPTDEIPYDDPNGNWRDFVGAVVLISDIRKTTEQEAIEATASTYGIDETHLFAIERK